MIYVALLRGVNVGGKNKIDMKRLKTVFERAGLSDVKTYINSGNIVFRDKKRSPKKLVVLLEKVIEQGFGFHVKVLLRDQDNIAAAAKALPASWTNDDSMKCDAMFLWEACDNPEVLDRLTIKPKIDDVKYVSGAILWRVDRKNVTKSGMMKLVGTDLYKNMTVRNCNTLRKLAKLMQGVES